MSEWITDRLPTTEDAFMDSVFVMAEPLVGRPEGYVIMRNYLRVLPGDVWQPIQVPSPYIKPNGSKVPLPPPPDFDQMVRNGTVMIREGDTLKTVMDRAEGGKP